LFAINYSNNKEVEGDAKYTSNSNTAKTKRKENDNTITTTLESQIFPLVLVFNFIYKSQ